MYRYVVNICFCVSTSVFLWFFLPNMKIMNVLFGNYSMSMKKYKTIFMLNIFWSMGFEILCAFFIDQVLFSSKIYFWYRSNSKNKNCNRELYLICFSFLFLYFILVQYEHIYLRTESAYSLCRQELMLFLNRMKCPFYYKVLNFSFETVPNNQIIINILQCVENITNNTVPSHPRTVCHKCFLYKFYKNWIFAFYIDICCKIYYSTY